MLAGPGPTRLASPFLGSELLVVGRWTICLQLQVCIVRDEKLCILYSGVAISLSLRASMNEYVDIICLLPAVGCAILSYHPSIHSFTYPSFVLVDALA